MGQRQKLHTVYTRIIYSLSYTTEVSGALVLNTDSFMWDCVILSLNNSMRHFLNLQHKQKYITFIYM